MKQVLVYSIQSEYIAKILNGLKTEEIRKRNLPQWALDVLSSGGSVEGYGYCTKGKQLYFNAYENDYEMSKVDTRLINPNLHMLNGRVVVKFRVSGTKKYVDCSNCTNNENGYECENDFMYLLSDDPILRKETCLTGDEIEDYGNGQDLYAHHITDITPVDMELGEFYRDRIDCYIALEKAPHSFMTAWVKGEMK